MFFKIFLKKFRICLYVVDITAETDQVNCKKSTESKHQCSFSGIYRNDNYYLILL